MPIDYLEGAEQDIQALEDTDPEALAIVLAFLEEADADPKLIEKFTSRGNVDFQSHKVNVKIWRTARRANANLFRIRVLDTPATSYRIIYGYNWRTRQIGILAIVHKESFDYGLSSEIGDRIQRDWSIATGDEST
jgi:mRNA-degrading endonuclease RelE of RelBE toxin-antitoxin system